MARYASTVRRILRSLVLISAAAAALAAPGGAATPARAEDSGLAWPFGVPADEHVSMRKRDLYNLGVLGVKVRDASAPDAPPEQQSGMRKVSMSGDPGPADHGPDRLKVEILYPDGPATKAGLLRGDILTGVNGKSFKDGSLDPIAKAIVKAEAGATKGGIVSFNVERAGATGPVKVDVVLTVKGKEWATPTVGKPRESMIEAACKWLAARQGQDGGYPQTLSSTNGSVVQTSVAGLCWLASGSDLSKGPYSENVKKALEFITANAGADSPAAPSGGANWSQSNWGWTHLAIFLGELHERNPSPEVKELLVRAGEEIAKAQEKTGGWAHGPGGPNALNYTELNIVTGLALQGLGMAQRAGYVVPKDVIERAKLYLEQSSGGDGGVGYSTNDGQRGQGNIGRTAAAWLGTTTLGLRKDPFALKMEKYVRMHAGEVFGGHASLMQHYLFAGVASQAIGLDAAKEYWSSCERDLVLAASPDGSFQPRAWHESVAMQSNSDVSFGEVWTTAAWTLVLAAEPSKEGRPGLPVWTGRAASASSKPKK